MQQFPTLMGTSEGTNTANNFTYLTNEITSNSYSLTEAQNE